MLTSSNCAAVGSREEVAGASSKLLAAVYLATCYFTHWYELELVDILINIIVARCGQQQT